MAGSKGGCITEMGNLIQKIMKVSQNPQKIIIRLLRNFPIPDDFYLKVEYQYKTGQKLNLDNPLLYNEKLQWLKLYNRHPEYTDMVDKYEVRNHVARTIGEDHLIPLLGVWDKFDDISFDTLP